MVHCCQVNHVLQRLLAQLILGGGPRFHLVIRDNGVSSKWFYLENQILMTKLLQYIAICVISLLCSVSVVKSFGAGHSSGSISFGTEYWPLVNEPLEMASMLIYGQVPLGSVPLPDYGQPQGMRLAISRSFSLWEDQLGTRLPSVGIFVCKLAAIAFVSIQFVLIYLRSQNEPIASWIKCVRYRHAFLKIWILATSIASVSILASNLAWMLWVKVYWIFYADTINSEFVVNQGLAYFQTTSPGLIPVALQTVPQILVALGGVTMYLGCSYLLLNKYASDGALRFGYCGECGYSRAGESAAVCPECGKDNHDFKALKRSRKRWVGFLLLLFGCFVMMCAPLWIAWITAVLPESVARSILF